MLREIVSTWGDAPVCIGCSGNFTIESVLSGLGRTIHSNDVSLYSGAIGYALTDRVLPIRVKHPEFTWLEPYLTSGVDSVAALLLCLEYLHFAMKPDQAYAARTWDAVRRRWSDLHAATAKKAEAALARIKIASYSPMDVVEFVQSRSRDDGVMAFPPTYKGGYERMFKAIDAVFEIDPVPYTVFDDERMGTLIESITDRRHWALYWDRDIPELADRLVGYSQASALSHPVSIYASGGTSRVVRPWQKLEPVNLERVSDSLAGPLELLELTAGQLNTLRSEYLNKSIATASAEIRLAVTVGGKLAGVCAFSRSRIGNWCDVYMMSDFAVAPTAFPRLSKLILAVVLSAEVRDLLCQKYATNIQSIGTTAFTDRPVSMKYRGLLELQSRKPGRLNYVGKAGKWTLAEAMQWWTKKYGAPSAS